MRFKKINLPFYVDAAILSLGADLKNRLCFAYGKSAFLSEETGDLKEFNNFNRFQKTISAIPVRFKRKPAIIACDLHPDYQSVKYISGQPAANYKRLAIQHHHAHICACMVENQLKNQKVIGVAFDGTGLGDDQTLWGAEFMVLDYAGFKRAGHLEYLPLPGKEAAIREPWRLAASRLYSIYKKNDFLKLKIDFVKRLDKKKWLMVRKMLDADFNSPLASSMGRLFDAASALVCGRFKVAYEGQAAIELEKFASRYTRRKRQGERGKKQDAYQFVIKKIKDKYIIDPKPMFKSIILDLENKKAKEEIAYLFHLTLAEMIKKICLKIRQDTGINKAVLSGGVFQNKVLLSSTLDLLYKHKFKVFWHQSLSSSDAAICLGQAAAANFKK